MTLGTLPDGSRGFDANTIVSAADAKAFRVAGYSFVVRYVRRQADSGHDISPKELHWLLQSGLAVMLVQHVAMPGWHPTGPLGVTYGSTAAAAAKATGLPAGVTLWCDLEGIAPAALPADVIAYCNTWYLAASKAGYEPGLYVGDACGLSAQTLYRALHFQRYWAAYNLNLDNYPAVRGVQMRQQPYPPAADRVVGCLFEYDEDVIHADALGGTPVLLTS